MATCRTGAASVTHRGDLSHRCGDWRKTATVQEYRVLSTLSCFARAVEPVSEIRYLRTQRKSFDPGSRDSLRTIVRSCHLPAHCGRCVCVVAQICRHKNRFRKSAGTGASPITIAHAEYNLPVLRDRAHPARMRSRCVRSRRSTVLHFVVHWKTCSPKKKTGHRFRERRPGERPCPSPFRLHAAPQIRQQIDEHRWRFDIR